jgi:hypothetical protein
MSDSPTDAPMLPQWPESSQGSTDAHACTERLSQASNSADALSQTSVACVPASASPACVPASASPACVPASASPACVPASASPACVPASASPACVPASSAVNSPCVPASSAVNSPCVPASSADNSPSRYFSRYPIPFESDSLATATESDSNQASPPAVHETIGPAIDPAFVTPVGGIKRMSDRVCGAPVKKFKVGNINVRRNLNQMHFDDEPTPAYAPCIPARLLKSSTVEGAAGSAAGGEGAAGSAAGGEGAAARSKQIANFTLKSIHRSIVQQFHPGDVDCRESGVELPVDVLYPLLEKIRSKLFDYYYVMFLDNQFTSGGINLYFEILDLFSQYTRAVDFSRVFKNGQIDEGASKRLGAHAFFNHVVTPWYLAANFYEMFDDTYEHAVVLLNRMDALSIRKDVEDDAVVSTMSDELKTLSDELKTYVQCTVDKFLGFDEKMQPKDYVYAIVNDHTNELLPIVQTALVSAENVELLNVEACTLHLVECVVKESTLRLKAPYADCSKDDFEKWMEARHDMIDYSVLLWGIFSDVEVNYSCLYYFFYVKHFDFTL